MCNTDKRIKARELYNQETLVLLKLRSMNSIFQDLKHTISLLNEKKVLLQKERDQLERNFISLGAGPIVPTTKISPRKIKISKSDLYELQEELNKALGEQNASPDTPE